MSFTNDDDDCYPIMSDEACCDEYIYYCRNITAPVSYPHFCRDRQNFGQYQEIMEEIFVNIDIALSITVILISIFGKKIEGTFKWCIANIAIFHLFYPVFTHYLLGKIILNFIGKNYRTWGWSQGVANVVINAVLTLGTQGVTTSLAASLPLALNRFLLTHQSNIYEIFFGNKKRIVFWLFTYDFLTFGTFFTLYILSTLSSWNFIPPFPTIYYNITTIAMVIIANSISLILMAFVLFHIYSSLALSKQLDQKQIIQERKRIAWMIIIQTLINCILSLNRIAAFYNVSQTFAKLPPIECLGTFGQFYGIFSFSIQEFFVSLDGLLYVFFLTPYRMELFRFVKWILRLKNATNVTVLLTGSINSINKSK